MKSTLNIDDKMLARAAELTGVREKTTLVRLGLEALVARESARRLGLWVEASRGRGGPASPSGAVILVDTSVWIDHFRRSNGQLVELLEAGEVAVHPFVVGELACGSLGNREEILGLLRELSQVTKADDAEVLELIERNVLMGRSIGLVDVHLLASCRLVGCGLWTRDKQLRGAAVELGIAMVV